MKIITCKNSSKKVAKFERCWTGNIVVYALQETSGQFEYWFCVGNFKTLSGAKRSCVHQFKECGYVFDKMEMKNLTLD